MLTFLINLFKRSSALATLERKKHDILSTFYKMSIELTALHKEQVIAIENLQLKLAELENEKREVEKMALSTEKTVDQISKIIGES